MDLLELKRARDRAYRKRNRVKGCKILILTKDTEIKVFTCISEADYIETITYIIDHLNDILKITFL